jgi:hypothetical protein
MAKPKEATRQQGVVRLGGAIILKAGVSLAWRVRETGLSLCGGTILEDRQTGQRIIVARCCFCGQL